MFSQYKVFSSKSVTETNEIFKFKIYIPSLLLKNIQKILSKKQEFTNINRRRQEVPCFVSVLKCGIVLVVLSVPFAKYNLEIKQIIPLSLFIHTRYISLILSKLKNVF